MLRRSGLRFFSRLPATQAVANVSHIQLIDPSEIKRLEEMAQRKMKMEIDQRMKVFGNEFRYWSTMKEENDELFESFLQDDMVPRDILEMLNVNFAGEGSGDFFDFDSSVHNEDGVTTGTYPQARISCYWTNPERTSETKEPHPAVMLVRKIKSANKSIDIAAFSFDDFEFLTLLPNIAKKGKKIRILIGSNTFANEAKMARIKQMLEKVPSDPKIECKYIRGAKTHGSMHWKTFFFDRDSMAIGAYNPTYYGKNYNWENCVLIEGKESITPMMEEFDRMFEKSLDIYELY